MIKDIFTFVIPCKNEEAYIEKTLRSIDLQKGIEGTEVIIADGGSTDSTISIINKLKGKLSIKVRVIKGGSVSKGRNEGAKKVKTEFIIFVDADSVLLDPQIVESTYLVSDRFDLITCKTKSISKSTELFVFTLLLI
jgi:glycosyltransferase involved in cell wall biosynthesis